MKHKNGDVSIEINEYTGKLEKIEYEGYCARWLPCGDKHVIDGYFNIYYDKSGQMTLRFNNTPDATELVKEWFSDGAVKSKTLVEGNTRQVHDWFSSGEAKSITTFITDESQEESTVVYYKSQITRFKRVKKIVHGFWVEESESYDRAGNLMNSKKTRNRIEK